MANTIKVAFGEDQFDLGNGRYSAFGAELARDIVRLFKSVPSQAVAAAKAAMSDCGRLNIASKITVGKAKGDEMKTTVKEVGSLKGVTMTHSLELVRAIRLLNDLEYVSVSAKMNQELQDWFDNLTAEKPITKEEEKNVPAEKQ